MKCVICKHGQTVPGTTTVTLERGQAVLTYKNVPAQVCENCGQAYVDSSISDQLMKAATQSLETGVEFDVRQYLATV